jgi:lambda family phage tail tape measure protein
MALGSLVVEVSANTAAFTSDMGKIAQIAETSMRRAEQAQKIAQTASDKFIASLKYQAETFGKTDAQILQYKADLLGAGTAAAPLIAQIEALKSASTGLAAGGGIKQTAHEMEGLSFQTAGAKRELLVLAHELSQGNFSRFGGSLLVLGERTGAAALLFSGLGLAALAGVGAIAAFGVAAFKGAEESDKLAKSLQLTGNFAGITEDQFRSLGKTIGAETGAGISVAREALSALAGSGKFTGSVLQSLSDAAVDISRLTGKTAEEVAKDFEKMSDGVSKYASTLNESYHFLSASQFEHIRQLEEEGKKQEAMAETGRLIDEALRKNDANLGIIKETLHSVGNAWSRFWDAALDIGRKETVNDKLKAANSSLTTLTIRLGEANPNTRTGQLIQKQIQETQDSIKAINAQSLRESNAAIDKSAEAQRQSAGIAASNTLKEFADRYATKAQQADKEIKQYKAAIADRVAAGQGGVDSEAKQQAVIASIRDKFADKKSAKPGDPTNAILVGDLKQQEALIAQAKQLAKGYLDDQNYYVKEQYITLAEGLANKKKIISDELDAIKKGYASEIAEVNKAISNTSDPKKKQEAITKRIEILAKQVAAETAANQTLDKLQKERDSIARDFALGTAEVDRQQKLANDSAQFQIDILGKSTLEVQKLSSARAIQLALEERIRKEHDKDKNADVSGAVSDAATQTEIAGKLIEESYAKQRDGAFGAAEAVRKYGEQANNAAAQIESSMTNAFKGAEDAFVSFATTGKLSFSSLANSIIAEFARIQAKDVISRLLGKGGVEGSIWSLLSGAGDLSSAAAGVGDAGAISGFMSGLGFAGGGDPPMGKASLVGEKGAELFVPRSAGTIIPNNMLGGSGNITYSPIINVDSRSDRAAVLADVNRAVANGNAVLVDRLSRSGRI